MVHQCERPLGDTELSYFLPSRSIGDDPEAGVNDMYLHIGLQAPPKLFTVERLTEAWAILRLRHPLLSSRVLFDEGDYDSARFSFTPPPSIDIALSDARETVLINPGILKEDLINNYLNGPRTLSKNILSALVVGSDLSDVFHTTTAAGSPHDDEDPVEFNVLLCTTHFIGDGHALHATMTELFALLGGRDDAGCVANLRTVLAAECMASEANPPMIPLSSEARLPKPASKLQAVASKVDFQCNESRLLGGQSFPQSTSATARKTQVETVPFDEEKTKAILKKCKSEGVTISNALFALCNIAWVRTLREMEIQNQTNPQSSSSSSNPMTFAYSGDTLVSSPSSSATLITTSPPSSVWARISLLLGGLLRLLTGRKKTAASSSTKTKPIGKRRSPSPPLASEKAAEPGTLATTTNSSDSTHLPMMMYTALNTRTIFSPLTPSDSSSVWFIAIGYFNVILPSFLPSSSPISSVFWKRAKSAKAQGAAYVKSPMLVGRTREMALMRAERAKKFAKMDDEAYAGRLIATLSGERTADVKEVLTSSSSSSSTSATPQLDIAGRPISNKAAALIGLSLLGNLDGTYKHASYPDIKLHTLNTGSRQRRGGMLMFSYSFASKLWISLGWDVLAFKKGVVEAFWRRVLEGVDEFLLEKSVAAA